MNNINLCGRLTNDPEVRWRSAGDEEKAFARFSLAVRRTSEKTDFFNCIAFGKTAEIIEKYAFKGGMLCVQGSVETGRYENSDGVTMPSFTVVVSGITLCGERREQDAYDQPVHGQGKATQKSGKREASQNKSGKKQPSTRHLSEEYDDELPFG